MARIGLRRAGKESAHRAGDPGGHRRRGAVEEETTHVNQPSNQVQQEWFQGAGKRED
jgi:hypothetical protein